MKNLIGRLIRQTKGFDAFVPHEFPPKQNIIFNPKIIKKTTPLPDYLEN